MRVRNWTLWCTICAAMLCAFWPSGAYAFRAVETSQGSGEEDNAQSPPVPPQDTVASDEVRVSPAETVASGEVRVSPADEEPSLLMYRLSMPYTVRGQASVDSAKVSLIPSLGLRFGLETGFRPSSASVFVLRYGADGQLWAGGRTVGNPSVNVREDFLGATVRGMVGGGVETPNHGFLAYGFMAVLGSIGHTMIGIDGIEGFHPRIQNGVNGGVGARLRLRHLLLDIACGFGTANLLSTAPRLTQIGSFSMGYAF